MAARSSSGTWARSSLSCSRPPRARSSGHNEQRVRFNGQLFRVCNLEVGSLAGAAMIRSLIKVTAWEKVSLHRRLLCAFGRVSILVVFLAAIGYVLSKNWHPLEARSAVFRGKPRFLQTDITSLNCMFERGLSIMFEGEPSDVQPFYKFLSQIRRKS